MYSGFIYTFTILQLYLLCRTSDLTIFHSGHFRDCLLSTALLTHGNYLSIFGESPLIVYALISVMENIWIK